MAAGSSSWGLLIRRRPNWAVVLLALLPLTLLGLAALAAGVFMIVDREAAEPYVKFWAERGRGWRRYDPAWYPFYVGLVFMLALAWIVGAIWLASAAPRKEQRLAAALEDGLEANQRRNTRSL